MSKRLTDEQINFIHENKKIKSPRQLASILDVPRKLVEEELALNLKPEESAPPALSKQNFWLIALLLLSATFLAFSNTLGHGFVWDDAQFIVRDKTLEDFGNLPDTILKPLGFYGEAHSASALWRPVVTFSLFVDTFLWGKENPMGYHLTNVLLHFFTGVLFFFFLKRFIRSLPLCIIGTLIYVLHPVQSEAIASVNGRGTPLSGLFVLLAFLAYPRFIGLSSLALLLALYSKETAVAFFGAIFMYNYLIERKIYLNGKEALVRYLPFLAVTAFYLVTRFWVLGGLGQAALGDTNSGFYSWPNRVWAQPIYFGQYFAMILMPFNLHPARQLYFPTKFFEPEFFFPFLSCVLAILLAWRSYKNNPKGLFGLVWFVLFLVPVLNFFIVVNGTVMEHWLYIPFMGFMLFVLSWVEILFPAKDKAKWLWLLPATLVTALGFLTFAQNKIWKDNITLFEYATRHVTRDPSLYNELGVAYAKQEKFDQAEEAFNSALKIDPEHASTKTNLDVLKNHRTFSQHKKNSSTPDYETGPAANHAPKEQLLEDIQSSLDVIETGAIPGLKEKISGGKKIYLFKNQNIQELSADTLTELLTLCDKQTNIENLQREQNRQDMQFNLENERTRRSSARNY